MSIAHWILAAFILMKAADVLLTVGRIGKPQKPLEPSGAAIVVLIQAVTIVGLVVVWNAS